MATKAKQSVNPFQDEWQGSFRNYSLRAGFAVHLSTSMLDFICAVADDVRWDHNLYWLQRGCPGRDLAVEKCLEKRGLIRRKSLKYFKDKETYQGHELECESSNYELTPAGEAVVELIKLAGIFVEADAATRKKARLA